MMRSLVECQLSIKIDINCTLTTKNTHKMKTRKKILIFAVIILMAGNLMAQTRQYARTLQGIEMEINILESKLSKIDTLLVIKRIQTLNERLKQFLPPVQAVAIRAQLARQEEILADNKAEIKKIKTTLLELKSQQGVLKKQNYNATVSQTLPKELRKVEKNRRVNSLEVRSIDAKVSKEELSLQKLAETPVETNGAQGYKVLIWNQDKRKPGNFKIFDPSGQNIDEFSVYLEPGEKIETYLLPGEYCGVVEMPGRITGKTTVKVGITHRIVGNVLYHGYLIQPPR